VSRVDAIATLCPAQRDVNSAYATLPGRAVTAEAPTLWPVQRDVNSAYATLPGRAVGNGLNLSHLLVIGGTAAERRRVARSFHDGSALRLGAFVAVNCARREPQLQESLRQWLGFTGSAGAPHPLWSAERGTLFLEAIGELARDTQLLLLQLTSRESMSPPEYLNRGVGRLAVGSDEDPWDLVARGRFLASLADALDKLRVELDPRRRRGTA